MTALDDVILQVHDAPQRGVVAVSGAGAQAVAWLLGVPGASRTILEATAPYSRRSMIEFLGAEPEQFVSAETARSMARAAFRRGLALREEEWPVVGLGCTAAIATDRPRRGEHRAHVATWDDAGWACYSLDLAKGRRDRAGEEAVVSRLVVAALAWACGIGVESGLDEGLSLSGGEAVRVDEGSHGSPLARLLSGEVSSVTAAVDGRLAAGGPVGGALLPGSFNPLHHGHEGLARAASDLLGVEVVYELSVTNVDKPTLSEGEITERLAQFPGKARVVLTRAETYRQKARLFPGCTFVVGWDTAVRLVESRYYAGEADMLNALAEISAAGCDFLVAGREVDGVFRTMEQVPVPPGFEGLFREIPQSVFRADISSSALRSGG